MDLYRMSSAADLEFLDLDRVFVEGKRCGRGSQGVAGWALLCGAVTHHAGFGKLNWDFPRCLPHRVAGPADGAPGTATGGDHECSKLRIPAWPSRPSPRHRRNVGGQVEKPGAANLKPGFKSLFFALSVCVVRRALFLLSSSLTFFISNMQ